jgi:hypothetical protein
LLFGLPPLPPLPNTTTCFLVLNFPKLAILVGEKLENNSANSRKNVNNKKIVKILK